MRTAWLVVIALVALVGCDPKDVDAGGDVSSARAPAKPASAGPADDEEIVTVDDTVPSEAAPADAGPEQEDDDEGADDDGCAPRDPKLKPMQLLRFTFADGIDGKDPGKKLEVAKAGQRVYAHLTMRNRSGRKRCLTLTFRVGGKKRTEVTLKIGKSWSWRTYAYNTLRPDDDKPLDLTVTDDQGQIVLHQLLAVIPRP